MTAVFISLFPSRRARTAPGRRRNPYALKPTVVAERLEERLALAIDYFQYPMNAVDSAPNNYAVLLLDQGDSGYLKNNATPSPSFTFANNSQFLDDGGSQTALDIGALFTNAGSLTHFFVTSGTAILGSGDPLTDPGVGTVMVFDNVSGEIDIGTNDGIVPGTFAAVLTVTDEAGNTASGLVYASSPGASWNLNFGDDLGSLKPSQGRIFERSGTIELRWDTAPAAVTLTPVTWAVYTGAPDDVAPLSFTVYPGQTITQSMIVDLSRVPSTVAINSPLLATAGAESSPFFNPNGRASFTAESVIVNSNMSSSSIFEVFAESLSVNRPVASPLHSLSIVGTPAEPGLLTVSEQGGFTGDLASPTTKAAARLDLKATHSNLVVAGIVNAGQQTYLLQSPNDARAYTFTTVSPTSGIQAGRIIGDTLGITLANDAGGEVALRTSIDSLRIAAASTPTAPSLPYAISVSDTDDLIVDAVPISGRPITIDSAGSVIATSALLTSSDLSLSATTELSLSGPISSSAGNVTLRSNKITSAVPITAGGTRRVSVQSSDAAGDILLDGLVRAGGIAKAPVRAATTKNVDLAAGGVLNPIDGIILSDGDRVLVKNQINPAENGIYVATASAWLRAADANLPQLLLPGFTVAVSSGAQQGNWTFANATIPTLDQTGLIFVPASAVQAYAAARVATTANVALFGLALIDGTPLAEGDRVLVKNQSNPRQNGLYVASLGAWARAADANTANELVAGSYVFVKEGSINGGSGFVLTDDAVQVGTTPLTFSPFTVQPNRTNNYSPARVLPAVIAATTVDIDLANPPSEVDGIDLVAGDLILVKNQVDASANGIYVYSPAALQRWPGATSSSDLPRGAMVFVEQGVANANSSWTFNDTIEFLGRTKAGSLLVTGLPSTLYLASGMLVTGPGIPANTRIDLVVDGTSVRLSKSAVATSSTAPLSFMQTSSVTVGTTPILFVPTGGTVAMTAGGNIASTTLSPSSRITASTAVLTAGSPITGTVNPASLIDVNSAIGRLTVIAPATIRISDSGAIDLFDARTLAGGGITVEAQGTLTARSVSAVGAVTAPADVVLTSVYGGLVAAKVTSTVGNIDLTAVNERAIIRQVGLNDAMIATTDGDVAIMANTLGIVVAGTVLARGNDGDITLQSNLGGLSVLVPSVIDATDRLTVTTPNALPSLEKGTSVSAAALTVTSHFGASQSPPTGFGAFTKINFNRTDPGSIVYSSAVDLIVEAATAVQGDITLTAPSLLVTGGVTAGSTKAGDGAIRLNASNGNIDLAAAVTAVGDRVTLDASSGLITQTAGLINSQTLVWYATTSPFPGLAGTFVRIGSNLTGTGDLSLGSANAPIVIVGASTVNGSIDITGSNVRIVDVIKTIAGNPVSVTATAGAIDFVSGTLGGVVALPGAAISLSATAGAVVANNKSTRTSVRGGPLTIVAQSADLKVNVMSFDASTTLGGVAVSAVGSLTLAGIAAPGQGVTLGAASGVIQAGGGVVAGSLRVTNGTGAVQLDSTLNNFPDAAITNGSGDVTLTSNGTLSIASPGVTTGGSSSGDGNIYVRSIGGSLVLNAGVTAEGDRVTFDATSGSIIQTVGAIGAQTLVWYSTTSPSLVGSFTDLGSNLTAAGNLSLTVNSTQRVLATSTVNGNISITGPSVTISESVTAGGGGSASVSATSGSVTLLSASGSVPSLNASGGLVNVSATDQVFAGSGRVSGKMVSITSGGTVFVGNIVSSESMVITTTSPTAGVDVGPQSGSLLRAGRELDLRNVQGSIVVRNGGRIIGNPLLLGSKKVEFGGTVTTVAELNSAITSVNALPAPPAGTTYEIIVGNSMVLTQTLTVTRPVTFRGTSTNIVLSGSPTATSGLVLNQGASGSRVSNITFSNFSADAIRATSVTNVTISGTRISNSGTGVRLSSVTSSTIGGTAAGAGNVFSNCTTGIFASGICTNTKLVKNTFVGTKTPYSVSGSRGITVVK